MTTVAEISGAVRRLAKRDSAKFRKWFVEYDAAAWDRQFEQDVADGRLDKRVTPLFTSRKSGRSDRLGLVCGIARSPSMLATISSVLDRFARRIRQAARPEAG